jgi:hypothetical protein
MEYAIMLPILILQVLLLPLSTGWIMSLWVDSRLHLELEGVANHVGSTIQQLYLSLNHEDVLPGVVVYSLNVPVAIELYSYYATGTLRMVSGANSSKILDLYFALRGKNIAANSSLTFGPNVQWQSSTFRSNSSAPCIRVQKNYTIAFPDGEFLFSFG